MPRQTLCGPTHCTNRVLSVLNTGEGSESTKAEQKTQGDYSKKKKNQIPTHQDGPQRLIWGEKGRRDGAIIKLTLSPDQSTIFSAEFAGNEGTNTAESSVPTCTGV